MKLTCTQENISNALSMVSRITTTRANLPILANVLLEVADGRFRLSSTDLEIGISTWIGAKIDQSGKITVPSRLLLEFINTNTDKNISLSTQDNVLELTSQHYNAHIKGLSADEFPIIPQVKADFSFEVAGLLLLEAINQTVFATALDDSRPVLMGVLFKLEKNVVKVVATDSFRLAEKTINLTKSSSKKYEFLVPARTLQELARLLSDKAEIVKIKVSSNQLEFNFGSTRLVSRLLDGDFPDYAQIIPTQKKTTVQVRREELINAIKMASFFAKESSGNIKFKLGKKNALEIIATSTQLGDNVSTLGAKTSGEEIEISFNARYLLDVLNVLDDDEVIFELNGKANPGLLRPARAKDYLYIIMPLRLGE